MAPTYENRRFQRVETDCLCTIVVGDAVYLCELLNASIKGLFVRAEEPDTIGLEVTVRIESNPGEEIELQGTILRAQKGEVILEVTGIERASFELYREFLVDHSDDPHTLDTEIASQIDYLPDTY